MLWTVCFSDLFVVKAGFNSLSEAGEAGSSSGRDRGLIQFQTCGAARTPRLACVQLHETPLSPTCPLLLSVWPPVIILKSSWCSIMVGPLQ